MENEDTGTNMCLQMTITLEIYLHMLSISSTNSLARFLLFCVSSVSIKAPYFQQDSTSNALHPKWKEMKEDKTCRWKDEKMRCNVSCDFRKTIWTQTLSKHAELRILFLKFCQYSMVLYFQVPP